MININRIFMTSKMVMSPKMVMTPKMVHISEISWIPIFFGLKTLYTLLEYLYILNKNRIKQIKELQNLLENTNKKYNDLQHKYETLYNNFQQLNIKFENLNNKMIDSDISDDSNTLKLDETTIQTNSMYRDLSENDNISEEFVDSLALDYSCDDYTTSKETQIEEFKTRTRSTSLTDINWTDLTKKFFFG